MTAKRTFGPGRGTAATTSSHSRLLPRPFVKWVGGKRQLLPTISRLLPGAGDSTRYFEPFLGSGALFFYLCRKHGQTDMPQARLSDRNPELIATYQAIRDQPDRVIKHLQRHEHAHSESHYYAVRADRPHQPAAVAARMIYLNRTGYNGLYRVNAAGGFNVPFGRHKNPRILDEANLLAVSAVLRQAEVACDSFSQVADCAVENDFVYFDPPYHPLSKTAAFTGYTATAFGEAEQEQLAGLFLRLHERGCWLMLSNSATPFVRKLYRGFRIKTVKARRAVNARSDRRGPIDEWLITNYHLRGGHPKRIDR